MTYKAGTDNTGFGIGDINGDGLADLVFYDATDSREYFLFGQQCGGTSSGYAACSATYDPTVQANGTNGFYLTGELGYPTFADVNGDGVGDLVVSNAGYVDIIFGHAVTGGYWTGLNGSSISSMLDGTHGTYIYDTGPANGYGMSAVADITGSGNKELIISGGSNNGQHYGSASPASNVAFIVPLNGFAWGSSSYTMQSLLTAGKAYWIAGDYSLNVAYGFSSVVAADINGDGINDIILACPKCTSDSPYGSVYVIYGGANDLADIDLKATPLNGSNGFRIDCSYTPAGTCRALTTLPGTPPPISMATALPTS